MSRQNPDLFLTQHRVLIILFLFMSNSLSAQISPGDLSKGHAHLEGISNCTQCHVLGDKVTNEKCLDCHKEIKTRIDDQKGYHASSEVRGKDCFACHSDHHGRAFQIIRFDTDAFDHRLTGYTLTGAHKSTDCRACHQDENIASAELRKKENTYLGLSTSCISCHDDEHQNTLSTRDCASCHTTEEFAPAALFDHNTSDFPLKGKHIETDCASCHETVVKNNKEMQQFTGMPFASCADCHNDVHDGRLGTQCASCHTEESFHLFSGNNDFNHSVTGFPLKGRHKKVSCASCHQTSVSDPEMVFKDYRNKDVSTCVTCHDDVHEGKFGTSCAKCHTEDSFRQINTRDGFDHTLTGYPLIGKHEVVDCKKCHETKMTDPVEHSQCLSCHEDFHKGQFIEKDQVKDCAQCHTEHTFAESKFTIEQHNASAFPLEGAHLATPCFSCHLEEEEWVFRDIGQACVDCHTDIHAGLLDVKYYPDTDCNKCHTTEGWPEINFDHAVTEFALEGRHTTISCGACHRPEEKEEVVFAGIPLQCASCHDNVHDRQFEENGETDCRRCHMPEQWRPSTFDHNTSRFVLDGAHKEVSCGECHKEQLIEGRAVVQYKMERIDCAACHL